MFVLLDYHVFRKLEKEETKADLLGSKFGAFYFIISGVSKLCNNEPREPHDEKTMPP